MNTFPLRCPDDLKEMAAAQAEVSRASPTRPSAEKADAVFQRHYPCCAGAYEPVPMASPSARRIRRLRMGSTSSAGSLRRHTARAASSN